MAKLSVIIPIYNVEKFIARCLHSLFGQSMQDVEFIFVNDGTPDKSLEILARVLDEYPHRIPQTIILNHDENKGLPTARRTGLEVARGDYVIHCDSDDSVDLTMYEQMYAKAVEGDYDMVICDYSIIEGDTVRNVSVMEASSSQERVTQLLTDRLKGFMCNKLVRRSIAQAEDIEWPRANMWEDMAVMVQLLQKAERVAYLHSPLYFYYKNTDSITNPTDMAMQVKKHVGMKENMDIIHRHVDMARYSADVTMQRLWFIKYLSYHIHDDRLWDMLRSISVSITDVLRYDNITLSRRLVIILCKLNFKPISPLIKWNEMRKSSARQ